MRFFLITCLALVLLSSCRTQRPVVNNYLLNVNDTTIRDSIAFKQPLIQKGDLLSIKIYSTANGVDPRADAPFNLGESGSAAAAGGAGGGGAMTTGYLVDESGNIEYPQIGAIHAEGMTREDLAAYIKKQVEGQLTQPSVIVRFLNFRITVLGEVGRPGTFTAGTERLSILEAIGLAGDITEFGQKNNVKVIRETNGQREIGTLDLTTKEFFTSPYYRLQQNDVVLVEQTRRKVKQQDRQELIQQIGIASSILTAIALVLNLIK